MKSNRYILWLLALTAFLGLWLGTTAETGVTGRDEYWVTMRTPLEMSEQGSFWTLWLNGEVRLKKPPLVYWAILGSYELFGVSVGSARLVGVLAGVGLVILAALLYRTLFGGSGLLAGLVCLSSLGLMTEGRRAMLDVPLAFFTIFSIYAGLNWFRTRRSLWAVVSALALGLSMLVKGPVGLVFLIPAVLAAALLTRGDRRPAWWHFLLWPALVLVLAMPWPLAMRELHPEYFEVVGKQIFSRRFGEFQPGSPLSALGGALGLVFPWSLAALVALVSAFRSRTRAARWLAWWWLISATPFFFMRAFERYMIPLVPCLAVLTAAWFAEGEDRLRRNMLRTVCLLLALPVTAICAFAAWFHALPWLALVLILLVLGLCFWQWVKPRPLAVAAGTAVILALLMGILYPQLGINEMPRWVDEKCAGRRVGSFGPQPAMLSVRLQRSVTQVKDGGDLARCDLVFLTEDWQPELERLAREMGSEWRQEASYRTLYSRKTWLRFYRKGATRKDWYQALRERSLEGLKSRILLYRRLD